MNINRSINIRDFLFTVPQKNEEVGGRESHERPCPVSTYSITLLCDTWTDNQQSHFMWVPCGPSTHLFICLLSISDKNQGSVLETSQNGIWNKTKQELLLSWGPLLNRQPDAHKITTFDELTMTTKGCSLKEGHASTTLTKAPHKDRAMGRPYLAKDTMPQEASEHYRAKR